MFAVKFEIFQLSSLDDLSRTWTSLLVKNIYLLYLNQEIVTLYYMNLIICYVEFKVRKIECIFDCKLYEIGEQIQFSTEISP